MHSVERFIKFFTQPLVALVYFTLIIAAYFLMDKPLVLSIHAWDLANHFPILVWLTQLGRSLPWLIMVPLIALFFRYVRRVKQIELRIWFLWATLVFCNGVSFVLKNLLGRARPSLLLDQNLFGFYGPHTEGLYHSFPSGHTTQITAMSLSLALLYPRFRWWIVLLASMVFATRVLLTYHYLSDILATFYLVILEFKILLYIVAQQCPLYWKRLNVR
ncbi:MAG: phosphatase PAP2 family protein [Legionellales bacterium]|nr:phosphatase PAP2 family protein [Legionellales bacterium]